MVKEGKEQKMIEISKEMFTQQFLFFIGALIATWYIIYWLWSRDYDKKNI